MSSLLALPVELLSHIITFVNTTPSLASLNQTCKLLHELTEGPLYESVLIINDRASAFATAIEARPERKAVVKEVTVDCNIKRNADEKDRSSCTQASLFAKFPNLEVLNLSSGYWHWDDDESDGEDRVMWKTDQRNLKIRFWKAGLRTPIDKRIWTNLRSCSLDFWELNGQGWQRWYRLFDPAIFMVASLEDLTLGGCRFTDGDGEALLTSPYRGQTALRRLAFERCYIQHTALSNFLCAPKALTHLTLGHDQTLWHHEMTDTEHTSDIAEDYMVALDQQKLSLQFLHMGTELFREIEIGRFDFSAFHDLREIQYDEEICILDELKCLRLRDERQDDVDDDDDEGWPTL